MLASEVTLAEKRRPALREGRRRGLLEVVNDSLHLSQPFGAVVSPGSAQQVFIKEFHLQSLVGLYNLWGLDHILFLHHVKK